MIFVTADRSRFQLERLARILFSAFPGSTIYQHTDPFRVSHDVLNNRVDAVLLEAEADQTKDLDFLKKLRRQKPDIPVFILAKTEDFCEKAKAAGANGSFILPDDEQQLLSAIRQTCRFTFPAMILMKNSPTAEESYATVGDRMQRENSSFPESKEVHDAAHRHL